MAPSSRPKGSLILSFRLAFLVLGLVVLWDGQGSEASQIPSDSVPNFGRRHLMAGVDWHQKPLRGRYSPPESHRERLPLTSGWRFHLGHTMQKRPFDRWFWDKEWETVELPHTWNALDGQDGGDDYYRGVGWYRRVLMLAGSYKDLKRRYYLQFDGAMLITHVWVNSKFVGSHRGGFSTFRFDITEHLEIGDDRENAIAVRVNNAFDRDTIPLWPADFTFFGGLYRNVSLLVTDVLHVTVSDFAGPGVKIRVREISNEQATVMISANLDNRIMGETVGTVAVVIVDAKENVVNAVVSTPHMVPANSSNIQFVHKAVIKDPRLWKGREDPYLYRVYIEVSDHGWSGRDRVQVTDVTCASFGIRTFGMGDSGQFLLNGQPYNVHGVTLHQDKQGVGWALSASDMAESVAMLADLGATAVRLSYYPQAQHMYDLLDRAGLIVWTEIPFVKLATNSRSFFRNAKEQLMELVRQNYNHASIAFWGLGHEQDSTDGISDKLLEVLANKVHSEDSDRLSVYAHSGETGRLDSCTRHASLIAVNKYMGWDGGWHDGFGQWVDIFHAKHPALHIGLSEYGAGSNPWQHTDEAAPRRPRPKDAFHPEEYQAVLHEAHWKAILKRPFLWGTFVQSLTDYASDWRAEGEAPGRVDKGLVTYDRSVKKDAYFWYKANWNETDPMVYITSRRFAQRARADITVKVYSNLPSVELLINDKAMGVMESQDKIFRWDVRLAQGENEVVAVGRGDGKEVKDGATWTLSTGQSS